MSEAAVTKAHPTTRAVHLGRGNVFLPFFVFTPIAAGSLGYAAAVRGWPTTLALLAAGLLSWTLIEYLLHRFSFHATRGWFKAITSGLHGLHHDEPYNPAYLVAPLSLGLPLYAILFLLVAALSWSASAAGAWGAGVIAGYLWYEWVHYTSHHRGTSTRLMKYLKRYHTRHHFLDATHSFGVTSPLWDHVFRTFAP
jgi:hypothetical protein